MIWPGHGGKYSWVIFRCKQVQQGSWGRWISCDCCFCGPFHIAVSHPFLSEHTPSEFMLDEDENNSSIFRECVSEALIKRSLAKPKKQPRRRATSAAHKRASKSLEYDDEETTDLAEFAEVRLASKDIVQRLRRSSSTSRPRYLPRFPRISKVSHIQLSRTLQN